MRESAFYYHGITLKEELPMELKKELTYAKSKTHRT